MKKNSSKLGILAAGLLLALGLSDAAHSADRMKFGFLATLSGPNAVLGTHLRDGFSLALDHAGGKLGGLPTEVIYEDDQQKPDVARQIVDKFLELNKVDIVAGAPFSSVLNAVYGPLTNAKVPFIGLSGAPSSVAGERCSEFFFSTSWQGDNLAEAIGLALQKQGVQNVYLMAPNFPGGKEVVAGIKRYYKGTIAGEVFTPLNQLDFAAELAQLRAAKPGAVFAFYPAGLGIQFVQQYAQAGLKEQFPLYTSYTIDATTLPALGNAALGITTSEFWHPDMDNEANKRFVSDFVKKYHYAPSAYAAQGYDAGRLVDGAVRKIKGKIEDRAAFAEALKAADFKSVRGDFKFNTNHFPIQNFYLGKVVKGNDGKPAIQLGEVILRNHHDAYAAKCSLK
ncbi:MAG: ABC transporter substrate-binding protein [Pseudomonadota bacterium]